MERLTEKDPYSQDYKIQAKNLNSHCVTKDKKGYVTYYGQHIDKLAEYEDLEEQGLLLRLPVKAGDIVYIISRNNEIIPLNVHGINIGKDDFTILAKNEKYCGYSILSLLGKYESVGWFLTQAEAEQKLKEMESD